WRNICRNHRGFLETLHSEEPEAYGGAQLGFSIRPIWQPPSPEGCERGRSGGSRTMAAGEITTLPAVTDDEAGGSFTPGSHWEPKRLYCKNGGFFLRIKADGRVDGSRERSDPDGMMSMMMMMMMMMLMMMSYFQFIAGYFKESGGCSTLRLQLQATAVGEVVIRGVSTGRFLAMNADGRLLGTKRVTDECYFLEHLESNNYNTYRSRKFPDWYVALTRTGQFKSGAKTSSGQKAVLFLPMSARC
ncbi:hypothetical protein DNTS_000632, partial [Danionella cerebrum]